MPPVLSSGDEENIMETGIGRVTIAQGLESIAIGSAVEDDIKWTSSISIFISRDDDCNLISNWEVVTAFISNTVEPNC